MLPNFIVIGAPRSGTSWIHKNLSEHPDIFMPSVKELHFFDWNYDKGIDYYMSFFEGRKGESAVGEATPDYLHGENIERNIPQLIKQHLPDVKLIASLRNPVERVYSRYWNAKSKYKENTHLSFEEKIRLKPTFIKEGFYYDQLLHYYKLFPREKILVLLFDDLESNPRGFLGEIYTFLGVDPNFESGIETIKVNMAAGKNKLGKFKALWYLHKILFRLNMFSTAYRVQAMNATELPPMSYETRKMLVDIYREKNLQLQELIDRDLSKWNQID